MTTIKDLTKEKGSLIGLIIRFNIFGIVIDQRPGVNGYPGKILVRFFENRTFEAWKLEGQHAELIASIDEVPNHCRDEAKAILASLEAARGKLR